MLGNPRLTRVGLQRFYLVLDLISAIPRLIRVWKQLCDVANTCRSTRV